MAPRFRIKDSNWFLGVEYRFEHTDTTSDGEIPEEETGKQEPLGGIQRVGGLTAIGAFDSRDNLYSAMNVPKGKNEAANTREEILSDHLNSKMVGIATNK